MYRHEFEQSLHDSGVFTLATVIEGGGFGISQESSLKDQWRTACKIQFMNICFQGLKLGFLDDSRFIETLPFFSNHRAHYASLTPL